MCCQVLQIQNKKFIASNLKLWIIIIIIIMVTKHILNVNMFNI